MAKILQFPQQIKLSFCIMCDERVSTATRISKNGSRNTVCLIASNCKKFHLCDALKMPPEKVKMSFVKCCGVCDFSGFCKYGKRGK